MPDRFITEEDENRQHSLCPFNVLGIRVPNRCKKCPAAARSSIQSRLFPRGDDAGPSTLDDLVGAESKINLLASSSGKGKEPQETELLPQETELLPQETELLPQETELLPQETELLHQETELLPQETELLQYEAQKLSLADPSASASGSCCASSGVPSQEDVVSKRKLENYQDYVLGPKFEKLSVQEWTIDKPLKPIVDRSPDVHFNKRLRQTMQISEPEIIQISEPEMMQIPEPQTMQNPEENHAAGRASPSTTTVFIPGFSMDIDVGVYSCSSSMEIDELRWRS